MARGEVYASEFGWHSFGVDLTDHTYELDLRDAPSDARVDPGGGYEAAPT